MYEVSAVTYWHGMSNGTGKAVIFTIPLPKMCNTTYSYDISVSNIRCGANSVTTGITVSSVSISGNIAMVTLSLTSATTSNNVANVATNSVKITF